MPPSKPLLYVDYDDILSDTARQMLVLLQSHSGKILGFEDIRSFDLAEAFGLSTVQVAEFMVLAHASDHLLNLPPVPGAVKGMCELNEMFEVWIVTGRPPSTFRASLKWLQLNGIHSSRLL